MNPIETSLAATNKAFIAYMMGNQTLAKDYQTLVDQGATVVEIGVPFTDPVADGAIIQTAGLKALHAGITLQGILTTIGSLPSKPAPIVLMTYLNPLFALGYEAFAQQCQRNGVSGVIVPDMPFEESQPLRLLLEAHGVLLITLVTATSTGERLTQMLKEARGFIYAVTVKGVTGERSTFNPAIYDFLAELRTKTTVPIMAGFGIATTKQVEALLPHCDGVIVGSRIVALLEAGESASIGSLIQVTKQ